MKRLSILCLIFYFALNAAHAEENNYRFDGSFQIGVLNLKGSVGESTIGVGGRFGYHLASILFLDADTLHLPKDPSGYYGETLILGGIRAGQRFEEFGIFAKARTGIINFNRESNAAQLFESTIFPAFDIGAILEIYPSERRKNFFVRLDISDCIIFFNNNVVQGLEGIKHLNVEHNPLFEFGIGFRF